MAFSFGLLGAGSQAREIEEYLGGSAAFRAIHSASTPTGSGPIVIDVRTREAHLLEVPVVGAVGAPGLRRKLVDSWSGTKFVTVISEAAWVSPTASVGIGATVAPAAVITAGATIGDHSLINVSASISHGSSVGAYVTVSPGARIAGDCNIGAGVFVGIGASISHGVRVSSGSVIGAGTVVVSDLIEPGVYVGNPARFVRPADSWLMKLM